MKLHIGDSHFLTVHETNVRGVHVLILPVGIHQNFGSRKYTVLKCADWKNDQYIKAESKD